MHELRRAMGVYQLHPGSTGWAQMNSRSLLLDEDKAAYDWEYLKSNCFPMDWKTFWMTLQKVLWRADVKEGVHIDSK